MPLTTTAFAFLRHHFTSSQVRRFKPATNGRITRTWRQLLSLLLIACMLSLNVPPVFAAGAVSDVLNSIGNLWRAGKDRASVLTSATQGAGQSGQRQTPSPGLPPLVRVEPKEPQSKPEREVKVAKIAVSPAGDLTLQAQQPLSLVAIPTDRDGEAIHGLTAEWESSDPQVVFISRDGQAKALKVGRAQLTARVAGKQEKIKVEVVAGERFGGKKKKDSTRQDIEQRQQEDSLKPVSRLAGARSVPAVWSRSEGSIFSGAAERAPRRPAKTAKVVRAALVVRPPAENDTLPDTETGSLYTPTNDVGTPPGRTETGAATPPAAMGGTEQPGSSNFNFGIPVVGLPGRGLSVSLGLSFNSRVWHQSTVGSAKYMTYDVDGGTPAPGFHLGYGHLEDQGSQGFTLVDSSGTRHQMKKVSTNQWDYNYVSTDGTFIHFLGGRGWGTVTYTDGTRVGYGASLSGTPRSYPTKITDRNGNYINITYAGTNNAGPHISTIQDTMGRLVRFHYSGANGTGDLRLITAPGYDNGGARQVARFYYDDIPASEFTHPFSGASGVTAPATVRVLRYVTVPGSNYTNRNGYRFDYWNTYGTVERVRSCLTSRRASRRLMRTAWSPARTASRVTGSRRRGRTTTTARVRSPMMLRTTPSAPTIGRDARRARVWAAHRPSSIFHTTR